MTVLDHPKHLLDAWSVCETLRRFGFRPDQMEVGFGPVTGVGDNVVFITLETEGMDFITAAAEVPEASAKEALRGWDELWQEVMHATEDELAVAMSKSISGEYPRVVRLAAELVARGIQIPFLSPDATSPLVLIVPQAMVMTRGGSA